MNRGKIEAKKPGKKLTTGQVVKTIGKTAGLLLAAGIALIALAAVVVLSGGTALLIASRRREAKAPADTEGSEE